MNLEEAVEQTSCDVLKSKLAQFLSDISNNLIYTFECPVCSVDLRSSYMNTNPNVPSRGTCVVCHLGIQMDHYVIHEGHAGCNYKITLPVSLCNHDIVRRLHETWDKHKFPSGQMLSTDEDMRWLDSVMTVMQAEKVVH